MSRSGRVGTQSSGEAPDERPTVSIADPLTVPDSPTPDEHQADMTHAALSAVSVLGCPPGTDRPDRPTRSGRRRGSPLAGDGAPLPALPREVRELRFGLGRTTRLYNAVMEEFFTLMRATAGAEAALAADRVPERGGIPVFRCSVAHGAPAPIANPSQPSHTVNFYELIPTFEDGTPLEPGTPLAPGVWKVLWTCPLYPQAHGGPAHGAFHIGVGVAAPDLPEAWARSAAGPISGAPGNVAVAEMPGTRLTGALRTLAAYREQAERSACDAMKGFVANKAVRVRNAHPVVFDYDDALQEGMARLVVVMRRFAARGRPKACWTVAAGLVLERDLPRAADRVNHVSSNVAHCAHWLVQTDCVDYHDPHLTAELAAAAYALDQRRRRRHSPGTRTWLQDGDASKPSYSREVWRMAIDEARRGGPVSLDRLIESQDADGSRAGLVDFVPVLDREIELVGERTLVDLIDDLLVGTDLTYEQLRDYLYPRLDRRDYCDETLLDATSPGPAVGPEPAENDEPADSKRLANEAENRLLALVSRPGESLARDRSVLRRRVRGILFDGAGRFRSTEDRRRLWAEHRWGEYSETADRQAG
jgi:hypothetical protein